MHLSLSSVLDQRHQTFLSSRCLKNMDCKSAAALLVVFLWPFITCQPWMVPSQNNLCLKKRCRGAGTLWVGRIASEPIRAHLLGAPAQETTNDTQRHLMCSWTNFFPLWTWLPMSETCFLPVAICLETCSFMYYIFPWYCHWRAFSSGGGTGCLFFLLGFDSIITGARDLLRSALSQTFLMIASDFSLTCPFP